MGGGDGGGRFTGTIGAGGSEAFSCGRLYAAANKQDGQSGRMTVPNDNAEKTYQGELGPYRGSQPAFHNAHPLIFDTEPYEWRRAPNAKTALSRNGFYECYSDFRKGAR